MLNLDVHPHRSTPRLATGTIAALLLACCRLLGFEPGGDAAGACFFESFDDPRLHQRGWYDGRGFEIAAQGAFSGSGCIAYRWKMGGDTPVSSSAVRRLFTPADSAYCRFYIKLSEGWGWSGKPYHPHLIHFMTTENDRWRGPASSRLTVYIEPWNGQLRLAAQDIQNADAPHGLTQGPLRGGYNGKTYDSREEVFTDNRWHCVEALFRLNSVDTAAGRANADGLARGWVDGKLVVDRSDLVLRSADFPDMRFNQFLLAPYFGPGLLPHEQELWIDALIAGSGTPADPIPPAESPEEAIRRRAGVAERRRDVQVICHRGASGFALENTLEAYRAALELGAGGNEIDIRSTKDGVLICFHDDMLDRLLDAHGDAGDYTWEELSRMRFRDAGPFGEAARIPALVEVLDLHRRLGGLLHLDIKRPGLEAAIAAQLDRADLWDHVAYCNPENAGALLRDPRLKLLRYKAPGLFEDRREMFPEEITADLKKPGDGLIVDDPRGAIFALGRKLGRVSAEPAPLLLPRPERAPPAAPIPEAELIAILKGAAGDGDRIADTEEEKAASGRRIRERARAAEQLLARRTISEDAIAALQDRVLHRSLHKDWMFHGLDGAMAIRTLLLLQAPGSVDAARRALWRDDPALERVSDPRWSHPRAWTDARVKMVIFPALARCPGPAAEKLCRDYLALADEEAGKLGPPFFEEAAAALLAIAPREETALELLRHRLRQVRGRTIQLCLGQLGLGQLGPGKSGEPWARRALESGARHALAFLPGP